MLTLAIHARTVPRRATPSHLCKTFSSPSSLKFLPSICFPALTVSKVTLLALGRRPRPVVLCRLARLRSSPRASSSSFRHRSCERSLTLFEGQYHPSGALRAGPCQVSRERSGLARFKSMRSNGSRAPAQEYGDRSFGAPMVGLVGFQISTATSRSSPPARARAIGAWSVAVLRG